MLSSRLLLLIAALICLSTGCRDKELEARERQMLEAATAKREKTIADVKAEAAHRLSLALNKAPVFDREAARRQLVLEKLKIDLTTVKLRTKDETRKLLEERASAAADEIYPPSKRAELVAQAEKEYPVFNVGDPVTVETYTNRGAAGVIEAIDAEYVKIGVNRILIKDIRSPDPSCFDREACEKQRRFVVHVNYDAPRRDELERQTKRLLPEVFRECGFVLWENQWRRVDELFEPVFAPLIKKQEDTYWQETEAKLQKDIETDLLKEGKLPFPEPIANPFEKKD